MSKCELVHKCCILSCAERGAGAPLTAENYGDRQRDGLRRIAYPSSTRARSCGRSRLSKPTKYLILLVSAEGLEPSTP